MESKKTFWHDLFYTVLVLGAAVAVCSLLSQMHDDNNPFAVLIFVLAVAIVALVTNGYLWGVAASVIGVFCVNFMFTYPFWSFDMSITGYPLTFIVLLVVSVVISTLTTRVKQSERLRYEVESEKLRADLLRALSHDLRTPLTTLLLYTEILRSHKYDGKAQENDYLNKIDTKARQIKQLSDNLFEYALVTRDTVVTLDPPAHFSAILEEPLTDMIDHLQQRGFLCRLELGSDDPLLTVRSQYVRRILDNITSNILKYADPQQEI